jgi:hypothetical protein
MGREKPPQTVGEALDWGWSALAFVCPRHTCGHEGRVDLSGFERRLLLTTVFDRCVCGRCGTKPSTARLAAQLPSGDWHAKRVDFFESRVLAPTRE